MEGADRHVLHISLAARVGAVARLGCVIVGDAGHERVAEHPLGDGGGASEGELGLQTAVDALSALVRGLVQLHATDYRRIIIWSESDELIS